MIKIPMPGRADGSTMDEEEAAASQKMLYTLVVHCVTDASHIGSVAVVLKKHLSFRRTKASAKIGEQRRVSAEPLRDRNGIRQSSLRVAATTAPAGPLSTS